jgi:outer membrane protein assembly factor BamD (BamD/ComL family)
MTAYQQNLAPGVPERNQEESVLKIAALALAQDDLTNAEAMLEKFLDQFPALAESELARLTLGELYLKDYIARPAAGRLAAAQANFDQFVGAFTNSPLAGRAYLDRGWSEWFAGQTNASLADFETAAQRLPPSADLAVARFKTGDALFAQNDFSGARTNYQSVLDGFSDFPSVNEALRGRALYQIVRADLELKDLAAANDALAQLLREDPAGEFAQGSALLFGENLLDPQRARADVLQKIEWQPALRAPVALAVARTYEQDANWPAAITNYQGWLAEYPTNSLRPQAEFALAWANFQAGNEADASAMFANFIAHFPAETSLAPQAQWWLADHFYRAGNFVGAETNYELIFQTPAWKNSTNLIYQAQLMAGRAAMARQDFSDAIHFYFTPLFSDTNCPEELRVRARFACGAALMQMPSTDTNNLLANYSAATNCFSQLVRDYPTNEFGVRAWGELGDCDLQLNDFDAATNAYAQVFSTNSPADASARSAAQVAFGITLEKMAALPGAAGQTNLIELAKNNYVDVLHEANLRSGEMADLFWVKKSGLRAATLAESLGEWGQAADIYSRLTNNLPQLSDLLGKKIAADRARLTP